MAKEFNVPFYMANQTKKLVDENGILCGTKKKLGSKRLDDSTVEIVQKFYKDESRTCLGLRDYKKVEKDNTIRIVLYKENSLQ